MTSFRSDRRGNVAVIFGLMTVPLFGLGGMALDYSRANQVRVALQEKADAVALNAGVASENGTHQALVDDMEAEIVARFGQGSVNHLDIDGEWINANNFRVVASATMDTALVHILPGIDRGLDISIESVVQISQDELQWPPPVLSELEPDAGDFNVLHAYCFDYAGTGPKENRRSQMVAIADNFDGAYDDFDWPECGSGEAISFRMQNYRHAKHHANGNPDLPSNPNNYSDAEYNFYTDTAIVGGLEEHYVTRENTQIPEDWEPYHNQPPDLEFEVLETVLCDTEEECVGKSKGGIIPEGTGRTPETAQGICQPGKYMYYGWEDRPPDQEGPSSDWMDPAWTDRSYDDIRIVMECPEGGGLGEKIVRLVK